MASRPSTSRNSDTSRSRSPRSSEPSGSSSISSRGSGASDRASATRWRSPPESASVVRRSYPASPTLPSNAATRAERSPFSYLAPRNPNATFFSTVRCGKRAKSWNIIPKPRRCVGTPVTSSPSNNTRPASGACSPATIRSSVVFPQPLGPRIASVSPGSAVTDTSSTIRRAPTPNVTLSTTSPAAIRTSPVRGSATGR